MAEEIIKDLVPITEGLQEINENLEKRGKKRKLLDGQDYMVHSQKNSSRNILMQTIWWILPLVFDL